jgi:hypothetical protein
MRGRRFLFRERFGYIMKMNPKIIAAIFLAGVLCVLAAAQTKPAAKRYDPLFFAGIAADVAGNVQSQSLNNFLTTFLDQKTWDAGLKDGDFGPFLRAKEAKPGRGADFLFSQEKDVAICVYFDGDIPFGVAVLHLHAGQKIEDKDVLAAYKPVTKEMLKKNSGDLRFTTTDMATDDGVALVAFQISIAGKPRAISRDEL